ENFQHDRIGFGADGRARGKGLDTCQHHMVMSGQTRLPAVFDNDCLVLLDNDRWAGNSLAALDLFAQDDARIVQFALREKAGSLGGRSFLIAVKRLCAFGFTRAAANGFDLYCVDNESLVFGNEAETALMSGLEFGAKTVGIVFGGESGFDGEDRIGASIADVGTQVPLNSPRFN